MRSLRAPRFAVLGVFLRVPAASPAAVALRWMSSWSLPFQDPEVISSGPAATAASLAAKILQHSLLRSSSHCFEVVISSARCKALARSPPPADDAQRPGHVGRRGTLRKTPAPAAIAGSSVSSSLQATLTSAHDDPGSCCPAPSFARRPLPAAAEAFIRFYFQSMRESPTLCT